MSISTTISKRSQVNSQAATLKLEDRTAVLVAMTAPEDWAIKLKYKDKSGKSTTRFVSPIRFLQSDRFLGLCLCREEPRQFYFRQCESIELVPAASLVMPMPIQ